MTKEAKKIRSLKVIEQSGYRYQATPTVMLKGRWPGDWSGDKKNILRTGRCGRNPAAAFFVCGCSRNFIFVLDH